MTWTRSDVIPVALIAVCILAMLIPSIIFFSMRGDDDHNLEVEGVVLDASNCHYTDSPWGSFYSGTVVLGFELDDKKYRTQTEPGSACDFDCCASLVKKRTKVWILLKNDDPEDVELFSLHDHYNDGNHTGWGVLFLLFAVFGCGLMIAFFKEFAIFGISYK